MWNKGETKIWLGAFVTQKGRSAVPRSSVPMPDEFTVDKSDVRGAPSQVGEQFASRS
jgi:hypothetical protein